MGRPFASALGEPLRPRAALTVGLVVAAIAGLLVVLAASAPARAASASGHKTQPSTPAPVPQGFVGVDIDGPMDGPTPPINLDNQFGSMVTNGVQSVRVAFNWAAAEPYENWSDVPTADKNVYTNVDGKPFDFQQTDEVVGDGAQHDITVLPTALYAPSWDARPNRNGVDTPKLTAPYGTYLTALIGRYGPHGSFWRTNPQIHKLPIRTWQIWNEENLSYYWPQPFAASYVGLLRTAHAAIKTADPGAKVVLGALTDYAWKSIGQIYRIGGARSLFDIVSINGFTKLPSDVILYMRFMRNAMDHFKDKAKPLLATEVSWPSSLGQTRSQFDFDTTEAGQARDIAALLPLIGASYKQLGLIGFYYYTWMGDESDRSLAFNFAGLLSFRKGKVAVKPALAAFRNGALALEQCKSKGALASSCVK